MGIEFTLWGLGGAVITGLIVQVAKAVWLKDGEPVIKDRWAVVAAIVVGLICSTGAYFSQQVPMVKTILDIFGAGLLAGLAACGLYSGVKRRNS